MHVIVKLFKLIEYPTPRVNCDVNCRLWVVTMCRCVSLVVTALMQDFESKGVYASVGASDIRELCTFLATLL